MHTTVRRGPHLLSVSLDDLEGIPPSCPDCGARSLRSVHGSERLVLACARCGGRWAVQLGHLVPVGVPRTSRTAPVARAGA